MKRFVVCVVVAGVGCGGERARSDASAGMERERLLRACAVVQSCWGGDVSQCILGLYQAPAKADCVLAAGVADCAAANACIGVREVADTTCLYTCVDADTLAKCDKPNVRTEIDCPIYIASGGPLCVSAGQPTCGAGACTMEGETTCNGAIANSCRSGVLTATDCSRTGQECVTGLGCVGASVGACSQGSQQCDGNYVVTCYGDNVLRRTDCSKTSPAATCIGASCGWASQCLLGLDEPRCADTTTLQMCALGANETVSCTSVGGTTCSGSKCLP